MELEEKILNSIKIKDLPKYVVDLLNRPFSIAVPQVYIIPLLEMKMNFTKSLKKFRNLILLQKITFIPSSLEKLCQNIEKCYKEVYSHLTNLIILLDNIYKNYDGAKGVKVVNIDGINKIYDFTLNSYKEFLRSVNNIYDGKTQWKELKNACLEGVNTIQIKKNKDGVITSKYHIDMANKVLTPVLGVANKIVCCEKQLKADRSTFSELEGIEDVVNKINKSKQNLKNINQDISMALKDPKFKKYQSRLKQISDKIKSSKADRIMLNLDKSLKSVKYSTDNSKQVMDMKVYLKTFVKKANDIFDTMEDQKFDDSYKENLIIKFDKYILNSEKTIENIIRNKIVKSSNPGFFDIKDSLLKYEDKLDEFLSKNIIKQYSEVVRDSEKSQVALWICSHARQIITAIGILSVFV